MVRALEPVRHGEYAENAFLAAVVVGLTPTVFHWSGLVVGGLLLGLVAPTLRRAVVSGLFFGLAVVVAFLVYLLTVGALDPYLDMGAITYLSVGIAFLLPTIAAVAARGLTARPTPES